MVVLGTIANNMPELPEVETVKNTLQELTLNKTITSVDVLREQTIDHDVENFKKALQNSTILGFGRVGKFIIFHLSNSLEMISHLRMEGKYFLKNEDEKLTKHDLVVFHFNDNTKLIYNDTRRFGRINLSTSENYMNEPPLSNVGPDPFMMKDASRLEKEFKNKSIAIKTALLDQSIMSGLGNIYVDEVLFETKIHPLTPAKLISRKQLEEILTASQRILSKAIQAGGSTIKSYHPKEGISGMFQVNLKVYGKKDGTCPNCGSHLRKIFVNGRGTTYCPNCQKNPANPRVIGITGPIGAGKSTISHLFENKGFLDVDTDKIVHELYSEKQIQNELKKIIPGLVITKSEINREWLRNYLIENPKAKPRLEKFVHAKVIERVEDIIKKSTQPIILEAPLLFESRLDEICDETIYVSVNKEKQIDHLNARGSNLEESLKINQNFNTENRKKATYIIVNNNDVANLESQVNLICGK